MKGIILVCLTIISIVYPGNCSINKNEVDIENLYKTLKLKASMKPYFVTDLFVENWNGTCEISCPNNRKCN